MNMGKVVQVIGPTVDVAFDPDKLPKLYNAIVIEDAKRGIAKYNPLAHWTEKDIWRQIHARSLPYHPLHDQGYESIGCAPCTQPGSGREGRWAGTDKSECGIHVA